MTSLMELLLLIFQLNIEMFWSFN